jgi:hypothetical protein
VLQWLRSEEPPCPWSARVRARAAEGGHLGVLQWLRSQHPPCPWDEWVVVCASQSLVAPGCPGPLWSGGM